MDREGWNARYASRPLVWSKGPNETIRQEVEDLPPGRALDVACGEGRNALWLAERGWQVTAMDFSETAIDRGRRIAAERGLEVDWVVGDVADFATEGDYDLVVVAYLHTGIAERRRWMQRSRDALRPGGVFLYVGHDLSNLDGGQGGPQTPEVLCTPAQVVAELPGFQVEKAQVVERLVQLEPGHGLAGEGIALDTLVRAVKA